MWNTSFSGVFRSYSTPSPVTEIAIEIYVAYIGGVVGGVGGWGVCVCVRVSVCVCGGGGWGFCETLRNTTGYVVFKTITSNLLEAFKNDYCYSEIFVAQVSMLVRSYRAF